MAERPLGWRPFTREERDSWRKIGFSEEQIDKQEETNAYAPQETAVWGVEFGMALLLAGGKHLGPRFVHDVRTALQRRVVAAENSENEEDRIEAPMVRRLVDAFVDWDAIIERADPAHVMWQQKPD